MEYFITIISCNKKQIWYKIAKKIQGGTFSWIKNKQKTKQNKTKKKKNDKKLFLTNLMF